MKLVNAGDYKFKQIAAEKLLVVVTSTQGEGEPPEEAVALHKFLFSKKAPKLDGTAFAVFGLGDTSYEFFCQSGKDFDNKLASSARNVCSIALMPTLNIRPRPLNGARAWLRR